MINIDEWIKAFLRSALSLGWKILTNFNVVLNCTLPARKAARKPRVHFPGAIPGNYGGPRVKVARLLDRFSNNYVGFNTVYTLSNYPYLSRSTLGRLRKRKIPIVLNQNGVFFPGWYGQGFDLKNSGNAEIYRVADYVFWQSAFARDSARRYLSEIDPPGEILFNAVDLSRFKPEPRDAKGRFTFLMAGNFNIHSLDQITLGISALGFMHSEKEMQLKIAGCHPSIIKQVKTVINSLNLEHRVSVTGRYSQSAAPMLMNGADAFIALKYMDTCPNLVIEALSCGVPVIYSKSGGTKELVDDSCGIGLEVEESWISNQVLPTHQQLNAAMLSIQESGEKMALAARMRAESMFDLERWYLRHEEVFSMLLDRVE